MDSSLSMSRTGVKERTIEKDPLSMVAMVARKHASPQLVVSDLEQKDELDLNDRQLEASYSYKSRNRNLGKIEEVDDEV